MKLLILLGSVLLKALGIQALVSLGLLSELEFWSALRELAIQSRTLANYVKHSLYLRSKSPKKM